MLESVRKFFRILPFYLWALLWPSCDCLPLVLLLQLSSQFLMLIFIKSSAESIHLIAGLSTIKYPLVYVELTSCKGSVLLHSKNVSQLFLKHPV
jgi:hypothetical protein